MHVIIIGCGKVGSKFANVLSEEGHDVVIVDNDREAFKLLKPDFNGITVVGVPIDLDVLKQTGIETADALAAVTPDDSINIMVSQIAKEIFKVPKVIARIYNPAREQVFHQFGLSTICPTNLTVDAIKAMILDNTGLCSNIIGGEIVTFSYENLSKHLVGRKFEDIEAEENMFLFGVIRKGRLIFYKPDLVLEKDDMVVIAKK